MKRKLSILPITLMFGIVGCGKTQNAIPNAQQNLPASKSTDAGSQRVAVVKSGEAVTVSDLMQSLDMRIFKTRINEPGIRTVSRVTLFVKLPESEPSEVVSIAIDDTATPGTLRVFLQELPWHEYAYRASINYEDENGRSRKSSGMIEHAIFRNVVGTRTGHGLTNQPGTAIIECSGTFLGSDAEVGTTLDAAAIFVRLE